MKRWVLFIFSLLFFILGGADLRAQRVDVVDGVAAIVNRDLITISQVRELTGMRERSLRDLYRGSELTEKIKEMRIAAVNDLIDRQLVLRVKMEA